MLRGTPVAGFIVVHPGIQFKAVEGYSLPANRDLGDQGAHVGVEAMAVHPEVARSVAKTEQARGEWGGSIGLPFRRQARVSGQGRRP